LQLAESSVPAQSAKPLETQKLATGLQILLCSKFHIKSTFITNFSLPALESLNSSVNFGHSDCWPSRDTSLMFLMV